jgi:phosphate transport system protein
MDIIATQQPVARDLRTLLAIGAIASELERAGDYAKGIAKRVSRLLQQSPIVTPPQTIIGMGEIAHTMLLQCLDAFVKRDVDLARQLGEKDKQVDALEDEVNEQIRQMIRGDISTLNSGLILIEITYMLERLADRTTNIGERVIYMVNSATETIND